MRNWKNEMAVYCKQNIEDYDLKVHLALGYIDRFRCPLSMANVNLYNEMSDCIDEFCEEHDLDAEDFDVEEIFWIEPNE